MLLLLLVFLEQLLVVAKPTSTASLPIGYRYDVDPLLFSTSLEKSLLLRTYSIPDLPLASSVKLQSLQALAASQNPNPFSIDFTCAIGVDSASCLKAQQGFLNAGNRIALILNFPQTVKVKATFRSFCNGTRVGCALNYTLGQASPAAYFSARTPDVTDAWYFYPQALVKQLSHDIRLVYNDYDILAEFNSDFNFWFSNDTAKIAANQTDFEFVVSHEFTHGLGFDTSWSQWGSLFVGTATSSSYLAPLPFLSGTTIQTATVPNWQPMTIFDKFTYDSNGNSIFAKARAIYAYKRPNKDFTSFITGFETSGQPFQSAMSMFDLVTSGSEAMQFKTSTPPGGVSSGATTSLILQTSGTYQPSSSIAHVDLATYLSTPEFLMVPAVQNLTGLTLDEIITKNTQNGKIAPQNVYGPRMVALMTSLGYSLVGSSAPAGAVLINPDAHSDPVSAGTHTRTIGTAVWIAWCCFVSATI